ncbi:hypothetical protein L7F22_006513 [Adiantum nelumboides]|nr:hypothetical protein [Adiantum nelumboides]
MAAAVMHTPSPARSLLLTRLLALLAFVSLTSLSLLPLRVFCSSSSLLLGDAASATGAPASGRRLHLRNASDFPDNTYIDRTFFPPNFIFGALTMAVKHEGQGSVNACQKADSIWDVYALVDSVVLDSTLPGNCGGEYDRYEEDLEIVEQMGLDAYRFSIAWTRIYPNGTGSNITPNAEAIAHYNAIIDLLLEKGIEPHVTLWAGDHPQALEDEYNGLLSARFIDDFVVYANACFAAFGDRVKFWITLDEPNDYASLAYASTQSPPGRCSSNIITYLLRKCTVGNSTTEPYIVGHNLLLAHAAAAQLYKQEYKEQQKGLIGIALWFKWYEPIDTTNLDHVAAAQRAQDFYFGWFMDPLSFGEYPESMRTLVGPRLPSFTPTQAAQLRGSWDFLGLNAVSAMYALDTSSVYQDTELGYFQDMRANVTDYDLNGVAIGEGSAEFSVPWCITRIVTYMRERYGNPPMYVTETGWGIQSSPDLGENLNDTERVQFFHSYYATLSEAIRDGGDVRGVFAWSLIDGFEVFQGLSNRFGLVYVDENMERYPRLSAFWHQMVVSKSNSSTLAIATHSALTSTALLK